MIMNKKLQVPHYLSPDATDLLTKLMRKKNTARLGYEAPVAVGGSRNSRPSTAQMRGIDQIKRHRFFRKLNWEDLYNRRIKPPIVPVIKDEQDVGNFHATFTSMPVEDSPAQTSGRESFMRALQNTTFTLNDAAVSSRMT